MILMDFKFSPTISYSDENWPMWKIYSVPCDSALNKFYCDGGFLSVYATSLS
jgi:hypothetical protein